MNFNQQFTLLIRARYPLIYIPTTEEERLENTIINCAKTLGDRTVYIWDFVDGYQGNPNDLGLAKRNPLQALEFLEKLSLNEPAIIILRDFHRFLDDISIARKLRNIARLLKSQPKNIIIVAPNITIPNDLSEVLTVLEFPLPNTLEIKLEIEGILKNIGQTLSKTILDELVRSCQGLSLERIKKVLAMALAENGEITEEDIE
ncbi:MAG TPA: AAA family ATPase, partial [Allocoleopsis sp.]